MANARVLIDVRDKAALARKIGRVPLEETLVMLPVEAGFVRRLFALPETDMELSVFGVDRFKEGYISLAQTRCTVDGIPAKK